MLSIKAIASLVVSLAAIQTASAAVIDTTQLYPEVIPGPGLPSPESLGLTSKDLHTMPIPELELAKLEARADPFVSGCGPSESAYTNVNGVIACYNYLRNLPSGTKCGSPTNYGIVRMCTSGTAKVTAQALTSAAQGSLCIHAAVPVLWAIDSCTRSGQTTAGHAVAYGNGNLIVGSVNVNY